MVRVAAATMHANMWRTIGHDRAVNTLKRSLHEGRLSHAYLLVGPRHVGKMTLALDLAQAVNCLGEERPCGRCDQCMRVARGLHADIRVVGVTSEPAAQGRSRVAIGIDQVREVRREASLKPYEGRGRVFIFDGAEHLSEEAANSLLKILEEPPEQVTLVLLASDADVLLPTIVSRCHRLELGPLSPTVVARELEDRFDTAADQAREMARLSGGRIGWAFQAAEQPDLLERRAEALAAFEEAVRGGLERRFLYAADLAPSFGASRDAARQKIVLWLEWWRDVLLIKEGVPEFVTNLSRMDTIKAMADALTSAQIVGAVNAVQEVSDYLEHNINPRLALEELMLVLPRP